MLAIALLSAAWHPSCRTGRAPTSPCASCRAVPLRLSAAHHEEWMLHALRLSERGRLSTAPNPWVGCVIVGADGAVLAEGFHKQKGGPHAEAAALADAREKSVPSAVLALATAYVTLEPCHMGPGKSTPACDEALVGAGIRSVHIALLDPDPAFGGGAAFLRSQGVEVTVGAAAEAVRASLVRVRVP
jgi:diaminohydroxyphosphoribosylaminopyrimidine deaminase/5-amino-6-(5-phosphoribosylamino)uracil reductase